jgi:hypothetical protein
MYSLKSAVTEVICPLARVSTTTNLWSVGVTVSHFGSQKTTCTLYSFDTENASLGTPQVRDWTGAGTGDITFWGPGGLYPPAATWSYYSVRCLIPGNSAGFLTGVNLMFW